ncbi:helix-turn-helix domain-containing protein [Cryobacterium sp. CAN_C2]|uniref:helix-turn-helix domain-containing protein n=1 Tax=Cryobacterium sp. CAN_C2 TaxID=2787723 RepID=UPI002FEF3ACC
MLSSPMLLSEVPGSVDDLHRACQIAPVGRLSSSQGLYDSKAAGWVASLIHYRRADLVGTVRSYLRQRGKWEAAARELGLHRNSLRHRISIATKLIAADPDDPDVSAELWLALRGVEAAGLLRAPSGPS